MTSVARGLALGLTGSFGSGCSTLARALESRQFQVISLSQPLKEQWTSDKKRPADEAPRGDLQDMGNLLAGSESKHYLAELAWQRAEAAAEPRVVFDGIKREDEVVFLREKYPNFCLIAVHCGREERWKRVKEVYQSRKLTEKDFDVDDLRDQIEEVPYGQQVSLCVDDADVVIDNREDAAKTAAVKNLGNEADRYLGLLTQEELCCPTNDEIFMSIAYTQAERSACIKRHVGAVIVDGNGSLVSAGFNENPDLMKACLAQWKHCRKDELMSKRLERLEGKFCPDCGEVLKDVSPPWRCKKCRLSLKGHYFEDHGVRWCQAVHAEERAIGRAQGRGLESSTLYTTTFPCLNCAKLIVDARIGHVVYVEPYPEQESVEFLSKNKVAFDPFQGVKARSFHRLFKPYRAYTEAKYKL